MRKPLRPLAAILAVAGATGSILCAAGIAGCWVAYGEAVRRVDRTFGRVENSLGDVRGGLDQAGDRLRRTRRELDAVREREADIASHPPAERTRRRAISLKAAEGGPRQLAEARQRIVRATEAALVAEGLMEALAELPFGERVGVEAASFRDASDRLGGLIDRSEKLAAALAKASPDPIDGPSEDPARISDGLDRVVSGLDAGTERLNGAHDRVRTWHGRVVRGITLAAAAFTLVFGWIGLGQLSLLAHGITWARRPRGTPPPIG